MSDAAVGGEVSPAHEIDMDELNDWSTSSGKSVSVRVGEGAGEGNRDEGKDSIRGDEENMSMAQRSLNGDVGQSGTWYQFVKRTRRLGKGYRSADAGLIVVTLPG